MNCRFFSRSKHHFRMFSPFFSIHLAMGLAMLPTSFSLAGYWRTAFFASLPKSSKVQLSGSSSLSFFSEPGQTFSAEFRSGLWGGQPGKSFTLNFLIAALEAGALNTFSPSNKIWMLFLRPGKHLWRKGPSVFSNFFDHQALLNFQGTRKQHIFPVEVVKAKIFCFFVLLYSSLGNHFFGRWNALW